jgi:hypothetical protein
VVSFRILRRIKPGSVYGPGISKQETALSQMFIGSLFGFALSGIFVSAEYFSYLYFLLGLVIALDKVLRTRRDMLFVMGPQRAPMPQPVPAMQARTMMLPPA